MLALTCSVRPLSEGFDWIDGLLDNTRFISRRSNGYALHDEQGVALLAGLSRIAYLTEDMLSVREQEGGPYRFYSTDGKALSQQAYDNIRYRSGEDKISVRDLDGRQYFLDMDLNRK